MTRGGDARIVLDPVTGRNRYNSAPEPADVLAFASSTANDISADAMAHLVARFPAGADALRDGAAYAASLDGLRDEIRAAYALDPAIDVLFAPSGTDLEYVGLLAVAWRRAGGIANLLLGADEVGSGCIHSAAGRYFAHETALDIAVAPGEPIAGLPPVVMGDLPVRDGAGVAFASATIVAAMAHEVRAALAADRFPLLHVVHGSKTGLVLPRLDHIDTLRAHFGDDIAFVVDACQARITSAAVHAFLDRGIIVFLTGSKFMGGPPFSGFALLPPGLAAAAAPPPAGIARVLRRAELPAAWPGREALDGGGNPGLALRLAAALFELARFQAIPPDRLTALILDFDRATDRLARDIDARKVAGVLGDGARAIDHPVEMLTLTTLDLSTSADGTRRRAIDFAAATDLHQALIADGIRLGQPVRCLRLPDGRWAGTLRIGLSMPQVSLMDTLADDARRDWLGDAMETIGTALQLRLAGLDRSSRLVTAG